MDRLAAMETFAKVVKYSSFTAAAESLGISKALVSRHITALEEHFGVRLINRTTRSVTPTEAGLQCYEVCKRVLADVRIGDEVIAMAKGEGLEGDISILCGRMTGNFDVLDALTDFCKENRKITLSVNLDDVVSVRRSSGLGCDIRIDYVEPDGRDIVVETLGELDYVLAASPDYLALRGEPAEPADLLDHDCLVQPEETAWCFRDAGPVSIVTPSRLSSNSFLSLLNASAGGLGIALLPRRLAATDFGNGRLRQVLPDHPLVSRTLFAAYSGGGEAPRRVRALVAYLIEWFSVRSLIPDDPSRVVELFRDNSHRRLAEAP